MTPGSLVRPFGLVFGATILAFMLLGCGPGEKSRELRDLERILQDPSASEVKDAPGASKPYREARQFRRLALEAWEDGKDGLSQEYAILGSIRYRTAAAIRDQVAAKERLDKANAQVAETNPEIQAVDREVSKLMTEVAQLERQVKVAERESSGTMDRSGASRSQSDDEARRLALNNRLDDIAAAKESADQRDAKTHAAGKYNRAENTLKSIQARLDAGTINDTMMQDANQALRFFKDAAEEAKPAYEEATAKANPEERRRALARDAEGMFGAARVIREPRGSRIIFPALFAPGASSVDSTKNSELDDLAKLAQTYDEFNIFIEGYTSRQGSATENLGTSQLRANEIRKRLTAAGVNSGRIETRGLGQDRPRFDVASRNERVEVVLSRSD